MNIDTNGFALEDVVRDSITGFEGTIVAITQWNTGCARATIQPKVDKDGKVPDSHTFDVVTLVMVKPGPRQSVKETATSAPAPRMGGPRPEPARQSGPTR